MAATDALRTTAIDMLDDSCGGAEDGDPNNVFGDGRIDAKAAVDLVATGGTLAGTITDAATADPIAGASASPRTTASRDFTATPTRTATTTCSSRKAPTTSPPTAFGYAPNLVEGVAIVADETTDADFALTALPRFDITGRGPGRGGRHAPSIAPASWRSGRRSRPRSPTRPVPTA